MNPGIDSNLVATWIEAGDFMWGLDLCFLMASRSYHPSNIGHAETGNPLDQPVSVAHLKIGIGCMGKLVEIGTPHGFSCPILWET